eukprot:Opistho-2@13465
MSADSVLEFFDNDPNGLYIAVAVVAILVVIVALVAAKFLRGPKRETVLLLGLCDAGKTALFYTRKSGKWVSTCTSMAENVASIPLDKTGRVVPVVDLPGHERLRLKNIERYSRTVKAIVFLIDSVHFPAQRRQVAELLHDVLSERTINRARVPVIVACNKSDIQTAKSVDSIKADLEKEIDTLRMTQAAAVAGQDGSSSVEFIGDKGKPFSFGQLRIALEFAQCSVKETNISRVIAFLRRVCK